MVGQVLGRAGLITYTAGIIGGLECQNYMIECRVNIDLHRLHTGFTMALGISQERLQGAGIYGDKKEGGRDGGKGVGASPDML